MLIFAIFHSSGQIPLCTILRNSLYTWSSEQHFFRKSPLIPSWPLTGVDKYNAPKTSFCVICTVLISVSPKWLKADVLWLKTLAKKALKASARSTFCWSLTSLWIMTLGTFEALSIFCSLKQPFSPLLRFVESTKTAVSSSIEILTSRAIALIFLKFKAEGYFSQRRLAVLRTFSRCMVWEE